jgi:hypothetical protein
VTKLDHARPILKQIDELKRQRTSLPKAEPKRPGIVQALPPYSKEMLNVLEADRKALYEELHRLACSVLAHV